MKKVCIEHVKPGMVLAKDIPGQDGSILLSKDTCLNEQGIENLLELAPNYIYIKPLEQKDYQKDLLRRTQEYVQQFFLYVNPDSSLFNEVFRLSLSRTLKNVQDAWNLPCSGELRLKNVEGMKNVFYSDQSTPKDIVQHETNLVSYPNIYLKIKEVLSSSTSSAKDIAKIVNTDIGLSAKLLRLVNSPLYGMATTIDSVDRAIAIIGAKELSTLAMGISAISYFKDIPAELMDMQTFWKHSLRCAIFAKLISTEIGLQPERGFTAGLLHDSGRLIMFKKMPYASVQALSFARSNMIPLVEAEEEVLGYNHAEVGKELLKEWQYPMQLADSIAQHHSPEQANSPKEASIIQLADNLANAAEISEGGKYVLPGMEDKVWDSLGLSLEKLQNLFSVQDQNIDEMMQSFLN